MSRDYYEKDISRFFRFVLGFKIHSREGILDDVSVMRVRVLDWYCRIQGRLFFRWFYGKFILFGKLANPDGGMKFERSFLYELKLRMGGGIVSYLFDSRENLLDLLVWLNTVGDLSDES